MIEVYMTGIIGTIQQLETASSGSAPTGFVSTASDGGTAYFRAMNLDQSGANTYDVGASSWGHAGAKDNGIGVTTISVSGIDPDEPETFTFTATTTLIASGASTISWSTTTTEDVSDMNLSITSGATGSGTPHPANGLPLSTTFTVTLDSSVGGLNGKACNIVYTLTATSSGGQTATTDSIAVRIRSA